MVTLVKIEWDKPEDKNWLNQYNIEIALSAYCKNTKFKVTEIGQVHAKEVNQNEKNIFSIIINRLLRRR